MKRRVETCPSITNMKAALTLRADSARRILAQIGAPLGRLPSFRHCGLQRYVKEGNRMLDRVDAAGQK
jgi:hypothetical protein